MYLFSEKIDKNDIFRAQRQSGEEHVENTKFNAFDKNNESKILEMYQNFVEQQLEIKRIDDIKKNSDRILKQLAPDRCPKCTLAIPCSHFASV